MRTPDWEAIKVAAQDIGRNWDMVDQGAFAAAAFQEKVQRLAALCGLCAQPGAHCQGPAS